ncbi:AMP-binding protein [Ramlibacter sp.]|uniref:AMP-binding protein n=1 Tax=Ramlibacter sp. TaxID=1917967 RepID=UPI003D14D656
MNADAITDWQPGAEDRASSGIAQMMRALEVESYDDLLAVSVADPARYWRVATKHCRIVWDAEPHGYLDDSAGREFPRWFPGGRLNWVNTALAWARREETAAHPAVVAEREDGQVESLTYAELAVAVREFAQGLSQLGVTRGDRVGLLMENGIEATVSLMAVSWLGAILVPLFSGFGVDAIVARLGAAEASVLLASTGFARRGKRVDVEAPVREAWAKLPMLRKVVWKSSVAEARAGANEFAWNAVLESGRGSSLAAEILDANDPFLVIYTSGTTGKPKGVVHTHGSFPLKIAHDAVVHFDVRPQSVFCWPADMGWIAGTLVLSVSLLRGATLVCYDGAPDFPDWSRMSRLVERHRITHFGSAPTLIRGMANNESVALQGDVSSVRLLITAGEGIDPEHFNWFRRTFGRGTQPVINSTGGTEASGSLLASVVVRPIPPSGFNTISPGVEVDVADTSGASLTGSVGELVVRQPFVGMTQSFWKDDERYLDTYWRSIPGVWAHGDLALRREDGNFFILGRSDDTLKVAGKRLGPAEVEEVVLELPQIAEAAAIGVSDAEKGQRLVVFVVLAATAGTPEGATAQQVTHHVGERLGKPFRPSAVHTVALLPKTRSSKIMRRVIRSVYCGEPAGDLSSLDNPASLEEIRALTVLAATR